MTGDIFIELSLIIIAGVFVSGIFSILKQPSIIGYILTGILVGPAVFNLVPSPDSHTTLATLGVSILLFMVGLHLNPQSLKEVGKVATITGIFQVMSTIGLGLLISNLFGFSLIQASYIAVGITFSSTIIIMKLVSDKDELDSLYGRISIGILIFQDIIAMLALLLVASFTGSSNWIIGFSEVALQAVGLITLFFFIGKYFLPKLMSYIAKSQEYLLFFSIGWLLAIAVTFHFFNLSIEVGALMAGITLSMSPFKQEISSKMKILRDFFVFLFFVVLGEQITFGSVANYIWPLIGISLFVLIVKPLLIMGSLGALGYRKRTSFFTGVSMAQISEFSLILAGAGLALGHISSDIVSFLTIIGLITIAISSYMIMHTNKLYNFLSPFLNIFEKKAKTKFEHENINRKNVYDAIIFGSDRTGFEIMDAFKKKKNKFLVVDFNPDIINDLRKKGINCAYGDAEDMELLSELKLDKAKIVVITFPSMDTNLLLLKTALNRNKNAIIICTAQQSAEALNLYERGASYVIMPHHISGRHTSLMIQEHGFNSKKFITEKNKHIKHLKKRQNFDIKN
ncbi:cation:proton antiporter [Candidatus Woesearchaeota archaeon]|nr:cation:proton antiporter [Candidatus Woesearchaeota archaeon]